MSRFLSSFAITLFLVCAWPASALAADWPWPVEGPVDLQYGAPWTDATGRTCTHHGIDIGTDEDASVLACEEGMVAFAGRVPAAGGGTVLAVTVRTADGLRVTYMPLASSPVSEGSRVAAGEAIGRAAPEGDGSSEGPHLHLSIKHGESSMDPMAFLRPRSEPVPVGVAEPSSPAPVSDAAGQGQPAVSGPAPVVSAPGAPVKATRPADSPHPVPRSRPAAAPRSASAPAAERQPVRARVRADARQAAGASQRVAGGNAAAVTAPRARAADVASGAERIGSQQTESWLRLGQAAGQRLALELGAAAAAALLLAPLLRDGSAAVAWARSSSGHAGPRGART